MGESMNAGTYSPKLRLLTSPATQPPPTEFSAADYLQLGRVGRRTIRIEVGTGAIEMVEGTLCRAFDQRGEGLDALFRLLVGGGLTGQAQARCYEGDTHGPRNLDIDLENALLEAARRLDESARDHVVPPSAASPSIEADNAAEAVEIGVCAVLAKDYERAYAAFFRAHALGDSSGLVTANLERLAGLLGRPPALVDPRDPQCALDEAEVGLSQS